MGLQPFKPSQLKLEINTTWIQDSNFETAKVYMWPSNEDVNY